MESESEASAGRGPKRPDAGAGAHHANRAMFQQAQGTPMNRTSSILPFGGLKRRSTVSSKGLDAGRAAVERAPSIQLPAAADPKAASRWVINPEQSSFLQLWDRVTVAALTFVALVAPVQVSLLKTQLDFLFVITCVFDMVFLIDLVVNFLVMYPKTTSYGYSLEHRPRLIARHYLRTWFLLDALSIVPFDLISLSIDQDLTTMNIMKMVRVLRLLKLVRVVRAARLFRRFEIRMSITYSRLALIKFLVILLVITHWLANLWAMTLVLVDERDGVPRWIDDFDALETGVADKTRDTPWKVYLACLYFTSYTITSVGYGDIGPKNTTERLVSTIMIIISGISWAVVLGQVCRIVATLNHDVEAFRSTMDELNNMMKDLAIPEEMRQRLRGFFLSNRVAQRRARHQRVMAAMSPGLRGQVAMEINRTWLLKVSFLKQIIKDVEFSPHGPEFFAFIVHVSQKMYLQVHAQSEVFGEPHVLYILSLGLASNAMRLLQTGAVWGADFVLSNKRYLENFETFALTYVEVTALHRTDFMSLVDQHRDACPEIALRVRRFCCWIALQREVLCEAKRRQVGEEARDAQLDHSKSIESETTVATP